jgi:hypothetical protein
MTKNSNVPLTNAKPKERLQELNDKLEAGERVTRRHLQAALTADEFSRLEIELAPKFEPKKMGPMPRELKQYAVKLRLADLLSGRKNHSRILDRGQIFSRGPRANGQYKGIESAYADALEELEQLLDDDPILLLWLDRPVDFWAEGSSGPSASPDGVPRLITSRSQYADTPIPRNTRALKRIALRDSLAACDSVCESERQQSAGTAWTKSKFTRGISGMHIDQIAADKWAFADGEWRVI